jgi:glutaredoxin
MFIIYSKEGCPYCTQVEQVLQLAELKYVVYKLGVDFTKDQFFTKFGYDASFPRVLKDENVLGGCTETVKYLREQKLV